MAEKKPDQEMFAAFEVALREGLAAQPDSMALYLMLGLCHWYQGRLDEAERDFAEVTSGALRLLPDDPMPIDLGNLVSFYWVNDARIREKCPSDTHALVSPEDVVKSYAWAYLAYIERRKSAIDQAYEAAANSLELFPYNGEVQRIYLRTVFDYIAAGRREWESCFLEAYEAASYNDRTIMHDFAAPAYHVLKINGRDEEAEVLLEKLKLYLSRVKLFLWTHSLYQELYPYNQKYGIPHANVINAMPA
ncbi:MAG TPA: hypothetical protein VFR09_07830 [Alphaproteobacteria bacterium]|nr:hypothetical protein [Alphaproteobacteria bacterium]